MEKMGDLQPRFSTELSPRNFGRQKKCRLESPQSSLWFPLAWVAGAQAKGKPQGNWGSAAQIFPKALHKKFWRTEKVPFSFPMVVGESSGEIWVQNPHFAY